MNASSAHANGNEGPTIFTSTTSGTPAVTANGTNGADGVDASSDTGAAVSASSINGDGVSAFSKNSSGVSAISTSGTGVFGLSKLGIGVVANSGFGTALQVQGHIQVQGDAVGQVTLPKGKRSVTVTTSAATATSNILLTLLSNPQEAQLWVARAAGSFTIHASDVADNNINIAFLVIN